MTAEDKGLASLRSVWPVALALAAGLALRLAMLGQVYEVNGDSLIYGGLARNLLQHGRYALNGAGGALVPTLIRLPGYPLFLALCFRLFGMENYRAAVAVQIGLQLGGCLLLAGFVRRIAPVPLKTGAAMATLWLAALCPFTASYAVLPLTEAPTLFTMALALWALARFTERSGSPTAAPGRCGVGPNWTNALLFTFAVTWAALLRPDGVLLGVALAPAAVVALGRCPMPRVKRRNIALVCAVLALSPFIVWTARNWEIFHVVEPLAPRLAADPGEDAYPGWESWVKTWCLDFVSTYNIYWNVPGGPLQVSNLPTRASDSPAQYVETAALIAEYNRNGDQLTPDLDARFARLAARRTAAHPLRTYLILPLGRLADMTLRPRVENLNIDLDWWVYAHHHFDTAFSWAYVGLNAFYLLLGLSGLCLRTRLWPSMAAYLVLRSALLLTVAAPETRYTLEFFPILFPLAGIALYRLTYVGLGAVLNVKASRGSL